MVKLFGGATGIDRPTPTEGRPNASLVVENRIVFNIGGNKYRLVVAVELSVSHVLRAIHRHAQGVRSNRRGDGVRGAMQIRPIKTKADHRAALKEIERLIDARPGTPAGDRLEILTTLSCRAYADPRGRYATNVRPVPNLLHG